MTQARSFAVLFTAPFPPIWTGFIVLNADVSEDFWEVIGMAIEVPKGRSQIRRAGNRFPPFSLFFLSIFSEIYAGCI
jgi:hypothetical protein